MKKLFILMLMIGTLFSGVRELTDENFEKATTRGLVAVEFTLLGTKQIKLQQLMNGIHLMQKCID